MMSELKVILSGGGTGGHIFPAIAIAEAIRRERPGTDFLFVGAKGRMEMERVPKAGYPIEGLWISGLQRKLTFDNLSFPVKLLSSLWRSSQILRRFRPDVAIGTGGYASGPLLRVAAARGIPTLIQEQNAYAGLTNKWLAGHVDRICVAYPDMERYFPAGKLALTGNPVRETLLAQQPDREKARNHYGLRPDRPTLLVTGGSLGARRLNETMDAAHEVLAQQTGIQVLWQCGTLYYDRYRDCSTARLDHVRLLPFLDEMEMAYAAADLLVCRAGALTIAEICLLGKASILVPSPNVAEDHQTRNAEALADRGAALLVRDAEAVTELVPQALALLKAPERLNEIGRQAQSMAHPQAARQIAQEAFKLIENKRR